MTILLVALMALCGTAFCASPPKNATILYSNVDADTIEIVTDQTVRFSKGRFQPHNLPAITKTELLKARPLFCVLDISVLKRDKAALQYYLRLGGLAVVVRSGDDRANVRSAISEIATPPLHSKEMKFEGAHQPVPICQMYGELSLIVLQKEQLSNPNIWDRIFDRLKYSSLYPR